MCYQYVLCASKILDIAAHTNASRSRIASRISATDISGVCCLSACLSVCLPIASDAKALEYCTIYYTIVGWGMADAKKVMMKCRCPLFVLNDIQINL